ncbi:DUF2834 domain-containing protein [Dermatophilaceae bacterium Soc4.6]
MRRDARRAQPLERLDVAQPSSPQQVLARVACAFSVREGWRLGWRWSLVLVPLTFVAALAFALPLFLALRERRLATTLTRVDADR